MTSPVLLLTRSAPFGVVSRYLIPRHDTETGLPCGLSSDYPDVPTPSHLSEPSAGRPGRLAGPCTSDPRRGSLDRGQGRGGVLGGDDGDLVFADVAHVDAFFVMHGGMTLVASHSNDQGDVASGTAP